jgi:hypothetical protein
MHHLRIGLHRVDFSFESGEVCRKDRWGDARSSSHRSPTYPTHLIRATRTMGPWKPTSDHGSKTTEEHWLIGLIVCLVWFLRQTVRVLA